MNDYDGLNLCAECGDAYTTGTLCHNCARQHAIDNDPMTEYDAIHYDPVYGYDDDDGRGDYDYGGDYETWQGDNIYADDETIDLSPSWRWKWYKFKSKMRYLRAVLSHPVHALRMKYDKRYRDSYWNDVIPY